jgi:RNA-directed DNA polymerase
VKPKAKPSWRFWGLYVHVAKWKFSAKPIVWPRPTTAPQGLTGVTFEDIEASGVEPFLEHIREELVARTYQPMRVRRKEIPKDGGTRVRVTFVNSGVLL